MEMATAGDFFKNVCQGHVLTCPVPRPSELAIFPPEATQLAVVSQTCDIVLPATKRPTVLLAPVVQLTGTIAMQARTDMPRYIQLPQAGSDCFADLAYIHAVGKDCLTNLTHAPGIDSADIDAVRSFALAVSRWFGRFAFPDEVVPWLRPLEKLVREKYEKPNSAIGRVLRHVVEIRVQAESWTARPLDLTLNVIVRAGTFHAEDGDPSEEDFFDTASLTDESARPAPVVAEEMVRQGNLTSERHWLEFARALANACAPKEAEATAEVRRAVTRVSPLLFTDDDFPLSRVRKSEILDVDYLSEGYPL